MAETHTITLADIRANQFLAKTGVEPGDTWTVQPDGTRKVTRVFSEPGGVKLGTVITEEHLKNQPELVEKWGAEVGDRYLPDSKKILKTGSGSGWQQFWYGYGEENNLTQNMADILESWAGIGRFGLDGYTSPDEAYGEGWSEADNETQRAMIRRARERELLDKYGRHFTPDADSGARLGGQVAGAIADPTSLIPFLGPAAKTASLGSKALRVGANIGTGGALGVGYSVSDDLARGGGVGDIDVGKALETGALAAAGTGLFIGAGKGVSKLRDRSANKQVDLADKIITRHVAAGADTQAAIASAQEEILSMGGMPIEKAMQRTGRRVRIPSSQTAAQRTLKDAAEDETVSRFYSKGVDNWLGSVSTRIRNISEPLFMRLRKYEFNTRVNTVKNLEAVEPFMKSLSKIKGPMKQAIARHLANGKFQEAERLMSSEMRKEFETVRKTLNDLGGELKASGVDLKMMDNYYPRLIKGDRQYTALLGHFGKEPSDAITKRLNEEAKSKGYSNLNQIPRWRKYEIANQVIKGYGDTGGKTKSRQQYQRKIAQIDSEMQKFYTPPEEALQMYIRNSVNSIERAKFFGMHQKGKGYKGVAPTRTVRNPDGSVREISMDESIGQIVTAEQKALNLDKTKLDELTSLLQSRFKGGEQSTGSGFGWVRDLGYAGTIANPISAITQLGDLGVSGALHGFRNTIQAMFKAKNVKMIDIGLSEVGQEFADVRKSSEYLRKMFAATGFRRLDRLGKETSMNAAFRKNFKLLKTAKGEAAFRKKWGKAYGDDIEQLISDLKAEKISPSTKFHAFNELSDMQPISMMEMPQKYLDHPDGRIAYALKTFTLKQYDVVRRNVVQEWKHGSKIKAVKQAGALAGYLSTSNLATGAIKDILLGRDPEISDPDETIWKGIWALAGVYGFNKYGIERYMLGGKPTEWGVNQILPATPIIDAMLGFSIDKATKEDPNLKKYLRAVPAVGPMLYNWFGGGAEKYNERVEKGRE